MEEKDYLFHLLLRVLRRWVESRQVYAALNTNKSNSYFDKPTSLLYQAYFLIVIKWWKLTQNNWRVKERIHLMNIATFSKFVINLFLQRPFMSPVYWFIFYNWDFYCLNSCPTFIVHLWQINRSDQNRKGEERLNMPSIMALSLNSHVVI